MTINQAMQNAAVFTRAQTLFTEGGYTYTADEAFDGWFDVRKPDGTRYSVSVDETLPFCSCPFFTEHAYCKHLLAVTLALAADAAMVAEHEAEEFGRFAMMSDAADRSIGL